MKRCSVSPTALSTSTLDHRLFLWRWHTFLRFSSCSVAPMRATLPRGFSSFDGGAVMELHGRRSPELLDPGGTESSRNALNSCHDGDPQSTSRGGAGRRRLDDRIRTHALQ